MKKVSRILALLLMAAMLVGVAACGGNDAPAPTPAPPPADTPAPPPPANEGGETTIDVPAADLDAIEDGAVISYMFWGDESEVENVTNIANAFMAEYPQVTVVPEPVDRADVETILAARALAGDLPDTGFLSEQMVLDWAREGFLGNPEGMYQDAVLDIMKFRWEGQTVGISSANEIILLYYNIDLFDEAGLDYPPKTAASAWTWDQFVDVAQKLTLDSSGRNAQDPNFNINNVVQWGIYPEQDPWMIEAFALANGGGFFGPEPAWNNLIIDQPASAAAFQKIADLHLVNKCSPQYGTFGYGMDGWFNPNNDVKVAMGFNGQWAIGVWCAGLVADEGLNYSVGVLPSMDRGNVTIATGGLAVLYEGSDYPNAAKAWLAFFAANGAPELIAAGIWMPIFEKYYKDEALMREWADGPNHPNFDDYRSAVIEYTLSSAQSTFWYWVPGADPFLGELGSAVAPIWSGESSAADALSAAAPAMKAAVGIG